jgi:hypothetical protein
VSSIPAQSTGVAAPRSAARKKHASTGRRKQAGKRKYGATASKKVGRAMHEMERGELRSGRSGKKVTSRKQAIAIGLSEARRKGAKVPKKKTS